MIVVLTATAIADLERIADVIAERDPRRAVFFIADLRRRCADLATMPERFPLVPRHETSGVRRLAHGNYLVFYVVRDARVVVLHILHGRMDYETILFPAG